LKSRSAAVSCHIQARYPSVWKRGGRFRDFVSGGIADAHEQSIFNRAKNLVVSA
jgi:hypothetical protein